MPLTVRAKTRAGAALARGHVWASASMSIVTEWARLEHAYGNARDLPLLLAAADGASEETGDEWSEVWGRLCHQGTVYSASYAALPELAAMASRHAPAGYVAAVHLAASIVASEDGPKLAVQVRQDYARELARLRELAEANLVMARDDTEFVYGLESLMAFEDGGVWQRCLDHVADGEIPMACPACNATLVLDLSGRQFHLAVYDDTSSATTTVASGLAEPGSVEDRLLSLAAKHGRGPVAMNLEHLFGDADCPSCGAKFKVPNALY